jgi:hypothetical protein
MTEISFIEKYKHNPEPIRRLLSIKKSLSEDNYACRFHGILMQNKYKGTRVVCSKFTGDDLWTIEISPVKKTGNTYTIQPTLYHNWLGEAKKRVIK